MLKTDIKGCTLYMHLYIAFSIYNMNHEDIRVQNMLPAVLLIVVVENSICLVFFLAGSFPKFTICLMFVNVCSVINYCLFVSCMVSNQIFFVCFLYKF